MPEPFDVTLSSDFAVSDYGPMDSTYSIVARDPETGQLGLGVQSKALSPGNRAVTGKGGVAIVAHQAVSNPMYGKIIIDCIERGMPPEAALDFALRADKEPERRQVAVIDIKGRSAAWTSPKIPHWAGHTCTDLYCVQGNTLAGPEVAAAMAAAFERATGPLAERLLEALDAGQGAGGDRRGMQGAALLVVQPLARCDYDDRVIDIRVDDNKVPLLELRRILGVTRAAQTMSQVGPLLTSGDLPGALAAVEMALHLAPEDDLALVALGDIRLRQGRRSDVFDALRRAIAANPAHKSQLMRNPVFGVLYADEDFLRLTR